MSPKAASSTRTPKRRPTTRRTADERFIAQLRKVFPRVIRERPEIAAEVEIQLRNVFAAKDDVRAILERLDREQAEWNERHDRTRAEWDKKHEEHAARMDAMQAEWDKKHAEQIARMDAAHAEWDKKHAEQIARMDAAQAEWKERHDRTQAEWKERHDRTQAEWNERHDRTQAEWNKRHDETARRLDDRITAMETRLVRRMDGMGSRWGMQAEAGFREGLAALVGEVLPQKPARWHGHDAGGEVYGHPSSVELDIVMSNGSCTVVEVKTSANAADVREFSRAVNFYDRTERAGKRSRRLIVTAWADDRAKEQAHQLGIEIYTGGP